MTPKSAVADFPLGKVEILGKVHHASRITHHHSTTVSHGHVTAGYTPIGP
jgi:hypothetical protein